jgi:hypothetical protein
LRENVAGCFVFVALYASRPVFAFCYHRCPSHCLNSSATCSKLPTSCAARWTPPSSRNTSSGCCSSSAAPTCSTSAAKKSSPSA